MEKRSRISLDLILRKNLSSAFLLIFLTQPVCAQIPQFYLDACYNHDYFTNLQGFEIKAPQESWGARMGFGFIENDSASFRLNAELGFSRRSLLRDFPGQSFRYSFNGLDLGVLAEYRPVHPLWLEGGAGFSLFYKRFRNTNSSSDADLGEGFGNFDFFLQGGANLQVYRSFFVGSRVRYGLVPHLNYTPIGIRGGLEEEINIINTLTWEFYLRIKLIGQ